MSARHNWRHPGLPGFNKIREQYKGTFLNNQFHGLMSYNGSTYEYKFGKKHGKASVNQGTDLKH